LIRVVLLSGTVALLIVLPASYLLAFFTFKMGLDPDDYVNPVVSSLSDLVMTVCLFSIGLLLVDWQ
ncbi:MAG: magnesium transporter MgtE, partial [Thermoprotei archaeon]